MQSSTTRAGLILAAGKGSRFQQETGEAFPKVLRPVLGRPMVRFVIDTLEDAEIHDITVIVGFQADAVVGELGNDYRYVLQEDQKGSGHAVACARGAFEQYEGTLAVMCGDSPLFTPDTVRRLLTEHESSGAAVTLASAVLEDPFGYGRIKRDAAGRITGVVEEKCASEPERQIGEVNGGVYAFDSRWLFDNIELMSINDAGEYNLTDMVRVAIDWGRSVASVPCNSEELLGVNTPEQLAIVENVLCNRGRKWV